MSKWDDTLKSYEAIVVKCPRFDRKGKSVPYTSANGHMFSFINKDGELGFRFSKETQEEYIKKFKSSEFLSHGSVMKGYVRIPENMFKNVNKLALYLNESYDYVMSLKPK